MEEGAHPPPDRPGLQPSFIFAPVSWGVALGWDRARRWRCCIQYLSVVPALPAVPVVPACSRTRTRTSGCCTVSLCGSLLLRLTVQPQLDERKSRNAGARRPQRYRPLFMRRINYPRRPRAPGRIWSEREAGGFDGIDRIG